MAIRKFNLLATSEMAEAPFRSLQEIDDYLKNQVKKKLDELDGLVRQYQLQFSRLEVKGATFEFEVTRDGQPKAKRSGGTFKIDKLTVPKMDTLRQNFSIVDEIADQVEALKVLYMKTKLDFNGVRGLNETLAGIKAMQTYAEAKSAKALAFLKTVGEKYAPDVFKQFVQNVMSKVAPELKFKNYTQTVYAYESAEGNLVFTDFIEFVRLEDEEGGLYPKFFIVLSCVLRPASGDKTKVMTNFYVNALHEFTSPAKALGRSVDNEKDAIVTLGAMLALENVGTGIGTIPHGVDIKTLKTDKFSMKDRIAKVSGDETSLTFEFVGDVDNQEATKLIQQLYLEVKGVFGHIPKARIKVRPFTVKGKEAVKFTLTNLAANDKVSVQDLDFMKEYLGIDDDKLRRIIRTLNSD